MVGGVIDGQDVSQAVTNPAFLIKNAPETAPNILTLQNLDVASGAAIPNTQRCQNILADNIGADTDVYATGKTYGAPTDTILDGDTHKVALKKLADKMDNVIGHVHDGNTGQGAQILATNLLNIPTKGYVLNGIDLVGVSGGSLDVSTQLTGKTPSSGSGSLGVVVTSTYNRVALRDSDNQEIIDPISGEEIYARLTESAGVWTLTFYIDLAGVETAYSIPSPIGVKWYYQEIFNLLGGLAPVYDPLFITPSDNTTADVLTATTTEKGKTQLAAAVASEIADTATAGTANATVANADHVHKGLRSATIDGDIVSLFGDLLLVPGDNITLTRLTGNKIEIKTNGTVGFQQPLGGTVDGSNDTFGPLTKTRADDNSVIVMIDYIPVPISAYSIVGSNIVFNAGWLPQVGQNVYAFYITAGATAGGGAVWGAITGTLSDQTDLQEQLNNAENVMTKERSGIDGDGIYTVVTYKRFDGTIIMESTLTGGTPPEYATRTVKFYEADGVTEIVAKRKVFTLSYTLGDLTSEVLT